jgi:hypothetical protein
MKITMSSIDPTGYGNQYRSGKNINFKVQIEIPEEKITESLHGER